MLVFCHLTWVRVISQFYSLFYYYFQHQYCVQSTGSGTTLNVEKTDDNYYSVLTVLFLFHFKYHCNLFFIFHFIILSGLLICSLFLLKEIFFFVYIFSFFWLGFLLRPSCSDCLFNFLFFLHFRKPLRRDKTVTFFFFF